MGGISSKEAIIERLDTLDREEININKQLRELQIELNGIVPVKDRVKVKKEYFDNISLDEDSNGKNDKDEEEIENENLEDLEDQIEGEEEEGEEAGEDNSKKDKNKKIKYKEVKKSKNTANKKKKKK